jgi:hypothetical protein
MYINEERLPGNSAITALAQMFIERVAQEKSVTE